MKNKKKILAVALCAAALAVLVLGAVAFARREDEKSIADAGVAVNAPEKQVALEYQGTQYPLKQKLEAVLLIGTDSQEAYTQEDKGFQDYYNYSQADFLMLLVLDHQEKTVEILQLNRDTMADVPWLDVLGNYGGTRFQQLCRAFNYGDGGRKSCKNTLDAVSRLLFDAPIHHYIQVPMSVIPLLNDLVGGVPVTIPVDMTSEDPAFVKGATVVLKGSQAETFVRARMSLDDGTNLARMERQRIYMESFQRQAQAAFNSDSQFAMKLVEKLEGFLQSDLTAQQLSDLAESLDKYQVGPIGYAEGELVLGEQYYEFYADESSLWGLVLSAYCA